MTSRLRPALIFAAVLLAACAATARSQGTATLRVKTDAADVEVWLDGESVGRTPLTLRDVAAGKRRIALLKDGYEEHTQDVEVSSGRPNSVFVVMRPRDAKLPDLPVEFKVVHSHAFGSCVGTLTVSAGALDYKAENDSDQYHIPITAIKSVVRTTGATRGQVPHYPSTDRIFIRIETPGRTYGFRAFNDTRKDSGKVFGEKTRELHEVILRLWSATLAPPQKNKD